MQRLFLKSKIHKCTVTGVNLDYEGSITIAGDLIEAAGLMVNEKVLVCNLENGERFETYVIEGDEGEIQVNGAAAHLAEVGDRLIVMSFCILSEEEVKTHKPTVVKPDSGNKP